MEIKTHIEKDKNKLPKHIIEFLHDGNKATFINGGQDSISMKILTSECLNVALYIGCRTLIMKINCIPFVIGEQIRMRNKKSKCKILYTNVCL